MCCTFWFLTAPLMICGRLLDIVFTANHSLHSDRRTISTSVAHTDQEDREGLGSMRSRDGRKPSCSTGPNNKIVQSPTCFTEHIREHPCGVRDAFQQLKSHIEKALL